MSDDDLFEKLERGAAVITSSLGDVRYTRTMGTVVKVLSGIVYCKLPACKVGDLCELFIPNSKMSVRGEVIAFHAGEALVTPLGETYGISNEHKVRSLNTTLKTTINPSMLGTVLDGFGQMNYRLYDCQKDWPFFSHTAEVKNVAPNPMERPVISKILTTGVKAIDGTLTLGVGQRIGLFAGPGCGKTTLMSSIARGAPCDVVVFGLIGERGRELREFVDHELDESILRRSVILCATSDRSAVERAKAVYTATAVAEAFRGAGFNVLLLIDSLTRFARAQREIGLAAGEPPARMGYTPSVYAELPRIVERAGVHKNNAISAIYTVLVEGEIKDDPIADEVKGLVDGHILLTQALGEKGHYPAIDVLRSISRIMSNIVQPEQSKMARRIRAMMARYNEVELILRLGEYRTGSDPETDKAIQLMPQINRFLQQDTREMFSYDQTLALMKELAA